MTDVLLPIPPIDEGDGRVVEVHTTADWQVPFGYALVGFFQEQSPESVSETVPSPSPNPSQGYGSTIGIERSVLVTKTFAVLRRSRDTQVQELLGNQKTLQKLIDAQRAEVATAEKETKKTREALSVLERRFEELSQNFGQRGIAVERFEKTLREMQLALADRDVVIQKLRAAFGEIRINEVLGITP